MALIKCSDCGKDISDAAPACPHCGRPVGGAAKETVREKKNPGCLPIGCAGIILLWLLGAVSGLFSTTDSSGRLVLPQPIAAPAPVVTKAEFDALREGISYSDAARIIGAPGEVLSSSDIVGIKTVMYQWANSNGSNMNAMFQDGKLISKAQLGLP